METAKVSAHIGTALYATEINAGKNSLVSDEPEEAGGKDTGFTPKQLLAASLAACTSITLRMYIQHKKWDLENIYVEVDLKQEADTEATILERRITTDGTLSDEQRDRLLSVANRCPVHKILTKSIFVNTII